MFDLDGVLEDRPFADAADAAGGVSTVLMSVNYVVWVLAGQFFFSYKLGVFPVWGYEGAVYLVLPVAIGMKWKR